MAEGDTKSITPRGAFIIGLVLGAGILLVFSTLQNTRLQAEISKMSSELSLMQSKIANTNAELAKIKIQTPARPVAHP